MNMVEEALHELSAAQAPDGFLERTLRACGLRDSYAKVATPIGDYFVAWRGNRVSAVSRADKGLDSFLGWFAEKVDRSLEPAASVPAAIRSALLATRGQGLSYDFGQLTEFEQAVLRKTLEIPRGEVRSYGWVAREIGRPGAVRAVGTALRHNPIPLLIPCHRVVRGDGDLGNYAGGHPELKKDILTLEGLDLGWLEDLARRRKRFLGSRTTHVFCHPTCFHARRIAPDNRVEFSAEQEARAAGYRPCRDCRPVAA
ncbi:MAG: methylated-DNA--[protein]-cysteine S-methyltransferase [Candidatus Dormibacteraeota bacterium]|uniref:methylated-DNA--[protein]-cysteine S-methyltransferase n=1 Tax=Candidatus Dormiibacter inghamiae TaxID=3127013 RepID=A0A934KI30_9BACT|nr:methylated-DNA--[protein]-cysteine S-methyltransferase [Candidatus Dormibacteraeota bacterium]MBJ7607676.1 methylated-DNA--[protein]-cysteine S-methyltransferase [Candidatus Dormibacteraeota bacterium]